MNDSKCLAECVNYRGARKDYEYLVEQLDAREKEVEQLRVDVLAHTKEIEKLKGKE